MLTNLCQWEEIYFEMRFLITFDCKVHKNNTFSVMPIYHQQNLITSQGVANEIAKIDSMCIQNMVCKFNELMSRLALLKAKQ